MNANEARAIAQSDLADALRDPKTTAKGLLVFKNAIALAEAECDLADARAAAAAVLRAEQAAAAEELRELEAIKAKAQRIAASQIQASIFNAALETARAELAKLISMVEHPLPMEIVTVKANGHFREALQQWRIWDVAGVLNIPPSAKVAAEVAERAQSVIEANEAAAAQAEKFRLAGSRTEQLAEIARQPAQTTGPRVNIFGNVLN